MPPAAKFLRIKKLPRQPTKATRESNHKGCEYYNTAREKKKGAYTMSTKEITAKVRELKELKAMAEELTSVITSIEDEIKAEMTARNIEEMTVDVYKIRWATINGSRFDSIGFKKAMPELYRQFTRQTSSRRFTVA